MITAKNITVLHYVLLVGAYISLLIHPNEYSASVVMFLAGRLTSKGVNHE